MHFLSCSAGGGLRCSFSFFGRLFLSYNLGAVVCAFASAAGSIDIRPRMQDYINQLYLKGLLNGIVDDEAHVLEQWGRYFRPEFSSLGLVRDYLRQMYCGRSSIQFFLLASERL